MLQEQRVYRVPVRDTDESSRGIGLRRAEFQHSVV